MASERKTAPVIDQDPEAYGPAFRFYDENRLMLRRYAAASIEVLRRAKAGSLLSLGIGYGEVAEAFLRELSRSLERYVIVEGSGEMIRQFEASRKAPGRVEIVHDWFERFETQDRFDAVEMGFVLEHVEDPELVLRRYARFLKPGGALLVAVPNARSLHRIIGKAAGFLDDVYRLSPDDLRLGHRRYFDRESVCDVIARCGYRVARVEGLFLKPLTSQQLRSLNLGDAIMNALVEVGKGLPDLCNAVFIEATPA